MFGNLIKGIVGNIEKSNHKMAKEYYSHLKDDKANALENHLKGVAKKAEEFTNFHDSKNWAYLAGIWHDLGKYQDGFQEYLKKATSKEDAHLETEKTDGGFLQKCPHSHAGAVHAKHKLGDVNGKILGYLIAGHHTGLPDGSGGASSLSTRLGSEKAQIEYNNSKKENIPEEILNASRAIEFPQFTNKLSLSIWIRMLFSCLVDADFLDTEEFMTPDKSQERQELSNMSLEDLYRVFTQEYTDFQNKKDAEFEQSIQGKSAQEITKQRDLHNLRKKIYEKCLEGAKRTDKFFSLTVPTGGGKTLSSLGFALEHAVMHKKKRIIYAIPYTSIIEQNADVFRKMLPENSFIEHHSNLDESDKDDKETSRNRLASENWDAPLIVTTNVQLFESLFASRTSRCRKLHRLQDSIIILDEAQMLPRDFLTPITETMKVLAEEYNVTWVLCTATQPNLNKQENAFGKMAFKGLDNVYELMQGDDINPHILSENLKRVDINFRDGVIDFPELAQEIIKHEKSVLAIVNTRNDCRTLYNKCRDKGVPLEKIYHLSALMCAQHRSDKLTEIKNRLKNNETIIVISTQLVEAGVDLDFPIVYRAMAGLDSIAQAAGRCNREGKLDGLGKVVVFNSPNNKIIGILKDGLQATNLILNKIKNSPLSPDSFKKYFEKLYDAQDDKFVLDKKGICKDGGENSLRRDTDYNLNFRKAAEVFKLIPEGEQNSVIVPYCKEGGDESPVHKWLNMLENKEENNRWVYRKLQRYTVNIHKGSKFNNMIEKNIINIEAGKYVLDKEYYNKNFGLQFVDEPLSVFDTVIGG